MAPDTMKAKEIPERPAEGILGFAPAPITRDHPTAFVLLLDQSGSMAERITFAGAEMTKARAVSLVAGAFIDELLYRARREGGVRDYYDIAALGYSGDGVVSLLSAANTFTNPSRLAATEVGRENVTTERLLPSARSVVAVTERNMWIAPASNGSTPMCAALEQGAGLTERWCRTRRGAHSHPPTVINITDGEVSDGGADRVMALAGRIRASGTSRGHSLFFNIHLAAGGESTVPVLFPSSPDQLPHNRYARLLWEISSEMPLHYHDDIRTLKSPRAEAVEENSRTRFRAMGWDCHIGAVAAMMNIGSVNSMML